MVHFALAWDSRCGVGESPVWDAANRRVLFCDIPGKHIHALSLDDERHETWDLPEVVASFGLCSSGKLVVALRHRVVLFDPRTRRMEDFTGAVVEPTTNRMNDGKVGPDGAFWVGSMDENTPRQPTGALYRVTPDGRIERKAEGYRTSNGLAWSPDGRTMYHSDTSPGNLEAWDFDPATGAISNQRHLATLTNEQGRPDGGATDLQGDYWSAGVSGCINRFSPDGKLLESIPFPVPGPTMPCFADGHLFVTSLRQGKTAEVVEQYPTLGGLFRAEVSVRGAPVGLFADG
ncbi:MAG TPA: SMP-30/gluconolactonase/LRE family protein [Acetobacteraceae bacterium]|nr:SMP-30/gluconolactonase/LRE family protein [Acetobacteraceae bacterium]